MRVFFALPTNQTLTNECLSIIKELKSHRHTEEIRWTQRDHLHITLRFIATITEEQCDQLEELLFSSLSNCEPITIATRRLYFLPPRIPHLIAMGIHLNEALATVYRLINDATKAIGLTPEQRPFVPHITLGRFKHPTIGEHLHLPTRPEIISPIHEIKLYKSEPNEHGSVYTELKSFSLGSMNL